MENMNSIAALRDCAERHLRHYIDPNGPRAFATYDRQGDPSRLEPVDCLAPALLSVRFGYRQVIPLFQPEGSGALLLRAMQAVLDDPSCTTADFFDISLDTTVGPWALVDQALISTADVPGVKAVAVTKILHRKRPYLIPIFDQSIYHFYTGEKPPQGSYQDTPRRLWPLLQDDLRGQREWLIELASPIMTPDERALSPLRAADIIIWEHEVTQCTAGPKVPPTLALEENSVG